MSEIWRHKQKLASTSIEAMCHWFICLFYADLIMRLLFVCVGNSCRSQMAEGIARSLGHDAASAGTHPASQVSANALMQTGNLKTRLVNRSKYSRRALKQSKQTSGLCSPNQAPPLSQGCPLGSLSAD